VDETGSACSKLGRQDKYIQIFSGRIGRKEITRKTRAQTGSNFKIRVKEIALEVVR
jgi:hypothetical protein